MNYYSNNRSNNILYDTLNKVVQKGISLMDTSLTDSQFQIWLDFSKTMIQTVTNNTNLNLYSNYLSLILSIYNTNLSPYQKLNYCIKYLLEVMKSI